MFTGIVAEVGRVVSVSSKRLAVTASKVMDRMGNGDSIAVNGACLTVTNFDDTSFTVDIMPETLKRTNLGLLRVGDVVNLERALTLDGLLGGHLVQGHIDAVGKIFSVTEDNGATIIKIEAPPEVMDYMVEKAFIAVDGVSLTVMGMGKDTFEASVVDYTLKNTTLGSRQAGDTVNLEADIIAKYVVQLNKKEGRGITLDFLGEHGFLAG
ncbi:MAG: riboflavin synthase [Dehalococcoidales bacterium]|nr:riboflavin synthase [Dehalococcoidales bacterium]